MGSPLKFMNDLPRVANVGDQFNYPIIACFYAQGANLSEPIKHDEKLFAKISCAPQPPEGFVEDTGHLKGYFGLERHEAEATFSDEFGWSYFVFAPNDPDKPIIVRESCQDRQIVVSAKLFARKPSGEERLVGVNRVNFQNKPFVQDLLAESGDMYVHKWMPIEAHDDLQFIHNKNKRFWSELREFIWPGNSSYEWALGSASQTPEAVTYRPEPASLPVEKSGYSPLAKIVLSENTRKEQIARRRAARALDKESRS